MKCPKCEDQVYVDAETDIFWCRTCGFTEPVEYRKQEEGWGEHEYIS